MKQKINNIEWLDTLRALAMLGVIIIHISTPILKMSYAKNMGYWWIGDILDSAVRFSVPLFLLLSGATMLGKQYALGEYYKKRMFRVLIPFLFWMAVYWVYEWMTLIPKNQPHGFVSIARWGSNLFLNDGISKHFWYIYMIMFLYLFIPFIGRGLRKLNDSTILYILIGWVIINFVCKSIPLNLYNWSSNYVSKLLGYSLFSGYLVWGYYLGKISFTFFKIRVYALVIFIISIMSSAIFTYMFSKSSHKLDLSMYSYLSLNTIVQTLAIFLWAKGSSVKNKFLFLFQHTISDYSYGIYLVHVMVIDILFNLRIFWTMANPLISLPIVLLLTMTGSFMIIYLLRKIPYGKYISG